MAKPKKISYYRKKADKLLQEVGRLKHDFCMVCGGEYNCLHHYWPKSSSSALRYDWENLIPICIGCHAKHHWGNPDIHNIVNKVHGLGWIRKLREKKEKIIKSNKGYYLQAIEELENERAKYS